MALIAVPKRIGYAGGNLKGLDRVLDEIVLAIDQGDFSGVTASAAELNVLDGIAPGLTAAELSKLDGAGAVVASGTAAAHIVAAKVDYADDGTADDLDTDAKRVAAANATNAKINAILVALEAFGITASS